MADNWDKVAFCRYTEIKNRAEIRNELSTTMVQEVLKSQRWKAYFTYGWIFALNSEDVEYVEITGHGECPFRGGERYKIFVGEKGK